MSEIVIIAYCCGEPFFARVQSEAYFSMIWAYQNEGENFFRVVSSDLFKHINFHFLMRLAGLRKPLPPPQPPSPSPPLC